MNKLYMGLDIGGGMAKGVIIDCRDNIIASAYLDIAGDPIGATKEVIKKMSLEIDMDNYQVVALGTTGSARKLVGKLLDAQIIKNEITTAAIGTVKLYPDVKTIIEIGDQDAKIILLNDGIVTDYAMNTSCASGVGKFLDNFLKHMHMTNDEASKMALNSQNNVDITSRCTVFAMSDIIHKISMGYKKEDVLMGTYRMIATNYMSNVAKGKKIASPIVFNGGVSKNIGVVKALEEIINDKIIVNRNSHLMGAFGVAIMARDSKKEKIFDFNIDNYKLETKLTTCDGCTSNCQIIKVCRNGQIIDYWGNRCMHDNVLKNV